MSKLRSSHVSRAGTGELGYTCLCHHFVYGLIKVMLSGMLSSSMRVEIRRDWSTNSSRILNIEIFVFVHAHGDMEQDRE